MSGRASARLVELANHTLSISPGSSEAKQNYSAIMALSEEVQPGEDLEFFSLCKMKFHTGRSVALLVTDECIYVCTPHAYPGTSADVKRLPRSTGSLRLTGSAGSEQVLHVDGKGLVLNAKQVSDLRSLGLHLEGEAVTSADMTVMPKGGTRLFVSHASEDGPAAVAISAALHSQGVGTWLATRDIQVGENYAAQIHDAIAASSHFVVLLSPASLASVHVQREVNLALDQGKALLPVVVSGDPDLMSTLPAEWKYWLGVVQVVPYSGAGNAVDILLGSIGSKV
jgi:hypothetical protein